MEENTTKGVEIWEGKGFILLEFFYHDDMKMISLETS